MSKILIAEDDLTFPQKAYSGITSSLHIKQLSQKNVKAAHV